jgi:serine protease Do
LTRANKFLTMGLIAVILFGGLGMAAVKSDYDARFQELMESLERVGEELPSLTPVDYPAPGLSTADIAEKAGASVVGITVTTRLANSSPLGLPQTREQTSKGSGIIASRDGYIITNYHVVKPLLNNNQAQLEVYLADGRSAEATYVGGDEQNDLAVIKIELDNLPVAEFGSSANLRIGEFAMAIGNPLGMEGSVTAGVISGINRQVAGENVAERLIQTDAAINPGNSGGALVNAQGKVIGVNTIKIAATDVEGIGFAIPIDLVLPIVEDLIEHGYVRGRPALGIFCSEISPMAALYNNVPQGLLVNEVVEGSGAEAAGIKANDIILSLAGIKVRSLKDVTGILKEHKVGDTVEVEIYRDGGTHTVELTLGERK